MCAICHTSQNYSQSLALLSGLRSVPVWCLNCPMSEWTISTEEMEENLASLPSKKHYVCKGLNLCFSNWVGTHWGKQKRHLFHFHRTRKIYESCTWPAPLNNRVNTNNLPLERQLDIAALYSVFGNAQLAEYVSWYGCHWSHPWPCSHKTEGTSQVANVMKPVVAWWVFTLQAQNTDKEFAFCRSIFQICLRFLCELRPTLWSVACGNSQICGQTVVQLGPPHLRSCQKQRI